MTLDGVMTAAEAHIEADTWISAKSIPVVTAVKGDVLSQVEQKIGKLGVCIVIEPGEADIVYGPTPTFRGELLAFFVFENVLLNRAKGGPHAVEVAAKLVHLFKPGAFSTPNLVITRFPLFRDAGKELVYRGSTTGALAVEEPTVEEPTP